VSASPPPPHHLTTSPPHHLTTSPGRSFPMRHTRGPWQNRRSNRDLRKETPVVCGTVKRPEAPARLLRTMTIHTLPTRARPSPFDWQSAPPHCPLFSELTPTLPHPAAKDTRRHWQCGCHCRSLMSTALPMPRAGLGFAPKTKARVKAHSTQSLALFAHLREVLRSVPAIDAEC
jgi:hypothetical protein